MIIVAGPLYVDPADRQAYLDGCREAITAARTSDGCLDFHLAADPLEADRINVFERWETVEAVEQFRGSGPSGDQAAAVRDAAVIQFEIASSTPL
jgi:quinol monooxygenase YgiN